MKTLAIRLDDELHAQLSVLAQLSGTSLTDEIRQALESHLKATRDNPELTKRAQASPRRSNRRLRPARRLSRRCSALRAAGRWPRRRAASARAVVRKLPPNG